MLAIRMPNRKIQNVNMERMKYGRKVSRNDPCPCGSGKKYKNCCLQKNNDREIVSLSNISKKDVKRKENQYSKRKERKKGEIKDE